MNECLEEECGRIAPPPLLDTPVRTCDQNLELCRRKNGHIIWFTEHLQRESGKTQTIKRNGSAYWQLMLLDPLRMIPSSGEASSGEFSRQFSISTLPVPA